MINGQNLSEHLFIITIISSVLVGFSGAVVFLGAYFIAPIRIGQKYCYSQEITPIGTLFALNVIIPGIISVWINTLVNQFMPVQVYCLFIDCGLLLLAILVVSRKAMREHKYLKRQKWSKSYG